MVNLYKESQIHSGFTKTKTLPQINLSSALFYHLSQKIYFDDYKNHKKICSTRLSFSNLQNYQRNLSVN